MDKLDRLIQKYVEAVMIHGKESWAGDYKKANTYYKVYTNYFIDICKYGVEGKNALKELLKHDSNFVRCSVAYHFLPFDSTIGIKLLKNVRENQKVWDLMQKLQLLNGIRENRIYNKYD